jgi:endo-1,4-beta-mannosidase
MKFSLLALLFIFAHTKAQAEFYAGFNQAWIFNRYGSQWVSGFDEKEFHRTIKLTKEAGGNLLRFWLFEAHQSESLIWENGKAVRLNPIFVNNLRKVLAIAKEENVKLNLTLLDGNMGGWKPPSQENKNFWWDLLNDKNGVRADFIENIYLPLLETISDPSYKNIMLQLDLANEINALTHQSNEFKFIDKWFGANKMICDFYQAKKNFRLAKHIQYTASVGWGNAAENILAQHPWPDCVDFFDFHVYSDGGDIPYCKELVAYARSKGKKIVLGEFGQSLGFSSDSLQAAATRNFLKNALSCGLDGALAWRLAEPDSSAYLSFEKNGRLRPAYYEMQKILKQR